MSKEIEDEFYCGEGIEDPLPLRIGIDSFLKNDTRRASKKLNEVTDMDFIRIWQSQDNLWDIVEQLQDHIGFLFTGTSMLRCIHVRALQLRRHGIRLKEFII